MELPALKTGLVLKRLMSNETLSMVNIFNCERSYWRNLRRTDGSEGGPEVTQITDKGLSETGFPDTVSI
jgi:hypothetical protein